MLSDAIVPLVRRRFWDAYCKQIRAQIFANRRRNQRQSSASQPCSSAVCAPGFSSKVWSKQQSNEEWSARSMGRRRVVTKFLRGRVRVNDATANNLFALKSVTRAKPPL